MEKKSFKKREPRDATDESLEESEHDHKQKLAKEKEEFRRQINKVISH